MRCVKYNYDYVSHAMFVYEILCNVCITEKQNVYISNYFVFLQYLIFLIYNNFNFN